jgi:hypothetical protein
MVTTLELVYEHRRLAGKCGSGVGLSIEEIQTLTTLESLFATDDELARHRVELAALLRGEDLWDRARIVAMGPSGIDLRSGATLSRGDAIEILIEDDELALSYRFRGVVGRTRAQADGTVEASIDFVGLPLLCRRGPKSDEAAVAAAESRAA